MAGFDGNGVWSRSFLWATDAANAVNISASRMDTEWTNISSGFNNCITRDGQGKPSSAIDWNGQNLTGVANLTVTGTFTLSGTLTVNAAAITSNATVGGTLAVTGATTLATLSATTVASSGLATLASATITAGLAVGTTLDVTGATTLTTLTVSGAATLAATSTYLSNEIGWRSIPRSTTTTTATIGDRAKVIAISAGLTIPNAVFAAGDAFSVYNDSAGALTITQGASLTLRQAATTNTGNRTLAARGIATVWFNSASEAIISGPGIS